MRIRPPKFLLRLCLATIIVALIAPLSWYWVVRQGELDAIRKLESDGFALKIHEWDGIFGLSSRAIQDFMDEYLPLISFDVPRIFPRVTVLDILGSTKPIRTEHLSLLAKFGALTDLFINADAADPTVVIPPDTRLPYLESASINGENYSENCIVFMSNSPKLTHVAVRGMTLSSENVAIFTNLRFLEQLSLNSCTVAPADIAILRRISATVYVD